MKKLLSGFILISVLNACGPSEAEMAKREVGVEIAAREELLRQQEHAKQQAELKERLIVLRSQLAGEETKLQSIEKFHLLRTQDEKAQQVTDQTRTIEEIRSLIQEVEKRIDN